MSRGAFYLGQFRLRHRLFLLRPGQKLGAKFYLGQVQLRPILVCPFYHPKCQDEKKEKKQKKREKEKETKGPGDAFTQTRLMSAFRVSTGLHAVC